MKGLNTRTGAASFLFSVLLYILADETGLSQAYSHDSLQTATIKDLKLMVLENQKAARRWRTGWFTGYSLATVAQTGIAITTTDLQTRQDMWNGAATTFLGAAGIILTRLVPSGDEIDKKMKKAAEQGHIFTEKKYYESILAEIAMREEFGRSWKVHAVAGVVDMASGLVTWLAFDRKFVDGIVTFAISTIVAECQIWTQPIRARKDYLRYLNSVGNGRLTSPPAQQPHWYFSASPSGAGILLRF